MRALLLIAVASCATSLAKTPVGDDFTELAGKADGFSSKMKLLGSLEFGQIATADYHAQPRYIAYQLYARAGERVVVDVTSPSGDSVAWLLDSSFHIVAVNDDASDATLDSHLDVTLPDGDFTYYVVVRDYNLADAQFTVSIAAPAHDLDAWRGRSIYFVVTDRFANGDTSNDNADGFASNLADTNAWHGGDFQGVIDHLDYIAGMGFTGIWITPVIQQHDAHAYHGYWGWDWTKLDGHLGDAAKLRELVTKAHARGIAVMIDTVANHTGRYAYKAPTFPDAAMYHHNGNITDYGNPTQVENNDLNGLNDLAQENPVVHQKLVDHVRWLVASTGLDGLRVDTVKHVPIAFWHDHAAASGVFEIGEMLSGSVDANAPYTHALDATLDYPLYYGITDVFGAGKSARELGTLFAKDSAYAHADLQGTFVDNHDQPRFLCNATQDQLKLALAFTFTVRGLPILYYGTEQAFASCTDNRADMFASFDATSPLYAYVAHLNQLRAKHDALRIGVQQERWQDDSSYAFEREAGTSAALVVFNLGTTTRTFALKHMHVPAGTVLSDGAISTTVAADQTVNVTVPAKSAVILTN